MRGRKKNAPRVVRMLAAETRLRAYFVSLFLDIFLDQGIKLDRWPRQLAGTARQQLLLDVTVRNTDRRFGAEYLGKDRKGCELTARSS